MNPSEPTHELSYYMLLPCAMLFIVEWCCSQRYKIQSSRQNGIRCDYDGIHELITCLRIDTLGLKQAKGGHAVKSLLRTNNMNLS